MKSKRQRRQRRRFLGSHDRWMAEGRAWLMRERLASGSPFVSGADLGTLYLREALVIPEHVMVLEGVHCVGLPSTRRRPTFTHGDACFVMRALPPQPQPDSKEET